MTPPVIVKFKNWPILSEHHDFEYETNMFAHYTTDLIVSDGTGFHHVARCCPPLVRQNIHHSTVKDVK